MNALAASSLCLVVLLHCLSRRAEGRRIHLGGCSLRVHMHELRKHYNDMRTNAITGDSEMGVQLLRTVAFDNVQGEACCFFHLLLRFYVERVFSSQASMQPRQQGSASALANAFLTLRRELARCQCPCTEETHKTMDAVHGEFIKLDLKQGVVKAVGELGTVLDWLEGMVHTQQRTGDLERR